MHRSLHIASFFTRPGALTGAAATVVDIPRPKGPGRPPTQQPHQEKPGEQEEIELLELPAAQPARKEKRKAPDEEEDQQLEPSRARKGDSDGSWRVQEKYGLSLKMMALYDWAISVEDQPEIVSAHHAQR